MKWISYKLIFVAGMLWSSQLAAQDVSDNDSMLQYNKLNGQYLLSIPQSFAYTVSRPFHWQGKDWAKAGITLGTIGTIMLVDGNIKSIVQVNRTRGIDKVFNTVEPFGNRYTPYLLAGMFLTGTVIKNERLAHTALGATRSLIVSTAIYTSVKGLGRRMRPDTASGPYVFGAPFKTGYTSFPSGHTNTVFSVATAIALEYKDVKWVPVVSYSIAGLTGISRIVQNRHWASDVVTGAVIGHFTARAVDAWERRQGYKRKPPKQVM